MAAVAVPALSAMAAEPLALVCQDIPPGRVADPLNREGLAGVECPLPAPLGSVLIISDANISWPVVVRSDGNTSFEDQLLGSVALLGPGQPYFQTEPGAVLFVDKSPRRVLIRFLSADPVTLERLTRWLVVAVDPPDLVGAAETSEAAAALKQ